MTEFSGLDTANRPFFFQANRPFHEAWYYLIDLPEHDAALWCRHTLVRPPKEQAYAELWGLWFESSQPTQTFREVFPLDSVRNSDKFFFVQTGKSWLRSQGALGYLSQAGQSLHWDLDFESGPPPHFPNLPKYLPKHLQGGRFCTPMPHMLCSGKIVINGKHHALDQEPGMLGHIWGSSQPHSWVWVHCNTFLEDAETRLEGVSAILALGPLKWPAQTFSLCYRGQNFEWAPLKAKPKWQFIKGVQLGECQFKGESGEWRFEAKFAVASQQLAQNNWASLDGQAKTWLCSKRGNAQLSVYHKQGGGWNLVEVLHAHETCSLEWVLPYKEKQSSRQDGN
ncbi:MAG: hypothetical protein IV090_06495 [Candidatus Sericytochromatia bacterium]|nr:hypothetical protein [Candidatus Sericytochromatia bacterium]